MIKKLIKTFLSIVLGFMVCGMLTVSASPQSERIDDYSQYINESFTASIDKIEIDTASYPIFIESHNSNEILVTAEIENSSYEKPLIVELFGDTLKITQKENARKNSNVNVLLVFRYRSTTGTGRIVVKVPIDSSYTYDVDNKGGAVYMSSLTTSSIDVSTDGGYIKAEKVSPQGNMIFRTEDGNIDLTNSSTKNTIDVITRSGKITLKQITCTDITLKGAKEDIAFSDLNAQNIIIGLSSGNVRGSIIGNSRDFSVTRYSRSGSNNLSNQAGSGDKTLNVTTISGDIYIDFIE